MTNQKHGLTRRSALGSVLGAVGVSAIPAAIPANAQYQAANPQVKAFEDKLYRATPLPLSSVRLTGGPLKAAQDSDATYLLALEPDRMLAYYRVVAGLPQKAEPYGGWDGGKRNLTGHIAGHYLSAVSYMYASTGNAAFKDRADYIVKELKEVQDKNGDGYLGALENGRRCFDAVARGEIKSGGFDLNGEWSPWYTLHKTYAGLHDAFKFTGNRTALEVEIKYGQWAEGILSKLNDAQIQKMLNTEFGGMNETFADLYAETGDQRWLEMSWKFHHRSFIDPLTRHIDNLGGKHGNTSIPQLIGVAARYSYTGNAGDLMAASFFWDRVVQHHTYCTGGHGQNEYFGEPDKLAERVDGRTSESCNIYNMLKLTRMLFALQPDVHYADFQERALFNHVLGSIDPEGRTCYMVPVGRGVRHEYQDMQRSFTCCVGSGMENHGLHGNGIYYEAGSRLWVNIYAPSTAEWTSQGAKLEMSTDFPEGESAKLSVTLRAPKELTLSLRRPFWAGEGFAAKVNGEPVALEGPSNASSYVNIKRTWKTGDVVELALPKALRLEATPDNPRVSAVMWGPLALAGDLGPEPQMGQRGGGGGRGGQGMSAFKASLPKTPVLLAALKPPSEWVKPVAGKQGDFTTNGVVRIPGEPGPAAEMPLTPFYRTHHRTYAIYFDMFTPPEWDAKQAEYSAEVERQRKLEASTVGFAQPGEIRPERDYGYQAGGGSAIHPMKGDAGRRTTSWMSFEMPVDASVASSLVVTYFNAEQVRQPQRFRIEVDGRKVADEEIVRGGPQHFVDKTYPIPTDAAAGKQKVTVKFVAADGALAGSVFGVRVVRAGN